MKKLIRKLWRIITYPLHIPVILNRKFWLHVSRKISKIEQSELAKSRAAIIELRASLMRVQAKSEELEAQKKQLAMELEMELMDKYIN